MKTKLINSTCLAAVFVLLMSCADDRNDPNVNNGNAPSAPASSEPANAGSGLDTVNTHSHTTSMGTTSAPHQKEMSGEDQSVGSTGSATGAE